MDEERKKSMTEAPVGWHGGRDDEMEQFQN
jgi:hypothetical protein